MKRLWCNYSLSLTLALLFLASLLAQVYFQMVLAGDSWAETLAELFANWQSEFLQLLTFVVLTSFLIHRGSHESKDSQDRLEEKIDRISITLLEVSMHIEALVEHVIDRDSD